MYRRGQIGKIITTFPVMIGIFIVMAGFIALSFGAKFMSSPKAMESSIPSYVLAQDLRFQTEETDRFLFTRKIKIDGKEVLIQDALFMWRDIAEENVEKANEFYSEKLVPALVEFSNNIESSEETRCLYFQLEGASIYLGKTQNFVFLFGNRNNMDVAPSDAPIISSYYNPKNCKSIGDESFNMKTESLVTKEKEPLSLKYYYGLCKKQKSSGFDTSEYINECVKTGRNR